MQITVFVIKFEDNKHENRYMYIQRKGCWVQMVIKTVCLYSGGFDPLVPRPAQQTDTKK